MANPPKCFLLPIDKSLESLRPVEFLARLYPGVSDVNLILSYFVPPLPPIYSGGAAGSRELVKKRQEVLNSREQDNHKVFKNARNTLLAAGFSPGLIQEHTQQKQMTVAKHACLLGDIKKVDAILVQKRVTSSLEGFLKGDSPTALLQHCQSSPVWFTEGESDARRAAICICDEDASLYIADHAGFMLSDSPCTVTILHVAKSVSHVVSAPFSEAGSAFAHWTRTADGLQKMPYIMKAAEIMVANGVDQSRISVSIIPAKSDVPGEILSWCASNGVSIIGLGHSKPEGLWSFLKGSVTEKILADFRNMAVWVTQ